MNPQIVEILVPVALDQAYSYRVPAGLELALGDVVRVPLRGRETTGAVWACGASCADLSQPLKEVSGRLEVPPLKRELRAFIDWVADYTLSSRGMVLRMALRWGERLGAGRQESALRLSSVNAERLTPARQRVLAVMADGRLREKRELAAAARVSTGVIEALLAQGVLERVVRDHQPVAEPPDPEHKLPSLSPPQAAAADSLKTAIAAASYQVLLLDGVTGAGKTEVYFEAIAESLRSSRQALILLPEIALTAQFVERFAARFKGRPALWHSSLSVRQRARTWAAVAAGEAAVVIGARSALFLPYRALGLIVVDEEHDPAYKQEDGVRYHARDMAVVRGRLGNFPVILASATPALETEVNARNGRYRRLRLPQRFGGQRPPAIEAIDLRREPPPPGRFISRRLSAAIELALGRGEQALLFLNRRGYAPLTLCRACGFRLQCPNCQAWLVDHRFKRRLLCHHCGFATAPPESCPKCEASGTWVACGPGVERLKEEVAARFPAQRTMVLSSDLIASVERMREEFATIAAGGVDIIIGTQLVAKGHHFPKLNLVGVVDGDLGLGQGDLRAAERTFQLLHQVLGRAGRHAGLGQGFIQTHQPEHPVIRALLGGDRDGFYDSEIAARQQGGYPPFGRLASLVVSGKDRFSAEGFARALAASAPADAAVRVLGPAEAPIAVIAGRHRFRLLVKSPRRFDLSGYLRHWLAGGPKPHGGVKLDIDIDPHSFW